MPPRFRVNAVFSVAMLMLAVVNAFLLYRAVMGENVEVAISAGMTSLLCFVVSALFART